MVHVALVAVTAYFDLHEYAVSPPQVKYRNWLTGVLGGRTSLKQRHWLTHWTPLKSSKPAEITPVLEKFPLPGPVLESQSIPLLYIAIQKMLQPLRTANWVCVFLSSFFLLLFLLLLFSLLTFTSFSADSISDHPPQLHRVGSSALFLTPRHWTGWVTQVHVTQERSVGFTLRLTLDPA